MKNPPQLLLTKAWLTVALLVVALLVIACVAPEPEPEQEPVIQSQPRPTVNPLLVDSSQGNDDGNAEAGSGVAAASSVVGEENFQPKPTVAVLFGTSSEVALVPTPTSRPLASTEAELNLVTLSFGLDTANTASYVEEFVYDDELNPSWTLRNSENVEYNDVSTARWYEELDESLDINSGAMSIAFEPKADFAQLFFTVEEGAADAYDRDQIIGVSFWLHTGDEIVDTGDFAVTIVGSNQQKYWSPEDKSVFFPGDESFSETALYFLDINRAIPASSWVKIEVLLDDLLYDPTYDYITGIYIKNDAGFRNRVYVDRVALLKLGSS